MFALMLAIFVALLKSSHVSVLWFSAFVFSRSPHERAQDGTIWDGMVLQR